MAALQNTGELRTPRSLIPVFDKAINRKVALNPNVSTQVLAVNSSRAYALVINNSDNSITLFLGDGTAVLGQGIILIGKGSSFEFNHSNLFTGRVAAIADTLSELSLVECSF